MTGFLKRIFESFFSPITLHGLLSQNHDLAEYFTGLPQAVMMFLMDSPCGRRVLVSAVAMLVDLASEMPDVNLDNLIVCMPVIGNCSAVRYSDDPAGSDVEAGSELFRELGVSLQLSFALARHKSVQH
jgi:hypothetical protein